MDICWGFDFIEADNIFDINGTGKCVLFLEELGF
jgi:hypothetical protein